MGMKKIYISGKITDNPNYTADFEAAELALKIAGFQPVNPAEERLPDGATWADYMRQDLKLLCDCDAIYMLNGWRESVGAKIEHKLARDLGIEIIYERKTVNNAEYRRAQYMKNREKILQKQKEYDDQHREEKLKKRKEYYNQHREETLKKQKEYYDQRREEIKRKARARYRAKCGLPPLKEGL